jgi:hypothetical protein
MTDDLKQTLLQEAGMTIHLLRHGFALCGRPGVPTAWGPDEKWTDDRDEATCAGCIKAWRDPRFVAPEPDHSSGNLFGDAT